MLSLNIRQDALTRLSTMSALATLVITLQVVRHRRETNPSTPHRSEMRPGAKKAEVFGFSEEVFSDEVFYNRTQTTILSRHAIEKHRHTIGTCDSLKRPHIFSPFNILYAHTNYGHGMSYNEYEDEDYDDNDDRYDDYGDDLDGVDDRYDDYGNDRYDDYGDDVDNVDHDHTTDQIKDVEEVGFEESTTTDVKDDEIDILSGALAKVTPGGDTAISNLVRIAADINEKERAKDDSVERDTIFRLAELTTETLAAEDCEERLSISDMRVFDEL